MHPSPAPNHDPVWRRVEDTGVSEDHCEYHGGGKRERERERGKMLCPPSQTPHPSIVALSLSGRAHTWLSTHTEAVHQRAAPSRVCFCFGGGRGATFVWRLATVGSRSGPSDVSAGEGVCKGGPVRCGEAEVRGLGMGDKGPGTWRVDGKE